MLSADAATVLGPAPLGALPLPQALRGAQPQAGRTLSSLSCFCFAEPPFGVGVGIAAVFAGVVATFEPRRRPGFDRCASLTVVEPRSEPREKRFTRSELRRMIDAGVFEADEHVELLHGRLVVVPPQGPAHSYTSTVLRDRLQRAYQDRALVREAKPLDCGQENVPEPDLAVVRGSARDYVDRDPEGWEAFLVVEVSRTTQKTDRDKASIYASANVPVYWLVDVPGRRVEVHTDPTEGDRYRVVRVLAEEDELEVAGPDMRWPVREVLP